MNAQTASTDRLAYLYCTAWCQQYRNHVVTVVMEPEMLLTCDGCGAIRTANAMQREYIRQQGAR